MQLLHKGSQRKTTKSHKEMAKYSLCSSLPAVALPQCEGGSATGFETNLIY